MLGKQNNWRHTWAGLPADSMWSVREQIVPTYAVIVERQANRFVVTNMATSDSITTPDSPDSPNAPNSPDAPGSSTSPGSGAPTLPPTAVEDMKTGDWDLTLFTCTLGGASRVTVRCEKAE